MKTRAVYLSALASACLLAACSSSSNGGSGTPPTLAQFFSGYLTGVGAIYGCADGIAPEYDAYYAAGSTEDSANLFATLSAEVSAGTLKFDPAKGQSCLAELTAATTGCFGPSGTAPHLSPNGATADCIAALQGTVAPGGACDNDTECLDGFCSISGTTCPGACTALPALGADCTATGSCQLGLSCVAASSGGGSVCAAFGSAGADCSNGAGCAAGLACLESADGQTQPVCGAPIAAGGTCVPAAGSNTCAAGYWCEAGTSSQSGTCVAQAGAGDPCALAGQYVLPSPACTGNQMCLGISGSPQVGHCATPQDVGGPCIQFDDFDQTGCLAGLVCNFTTLTCETAPAAGSACVENQCDPLTAFCDSNGMCQALEADGAACTVSNIDGAASQCLSGYCDTSSDPNNTAGTCAAPTSACPGS